MRKRKLIWHGIHFSTQAFIVSLVVLSLLGAYIGTKGNRITFSTLSTQAYEDVVFPSQAPDMVSLGGWFFPAASDTTVIVVHGWGGHRGRMLELVEYLQRNGVNVLAFDLRGGSGRNTYGDSEAGDVAGAVTWLKANKPGAAKQLVILGVSIGTTGAVAYTANNPVDKLVLISPVIDIYDTKRLALHQRHIPFPNVYIRGATWVEHKLFGIDHQNPSELFQQVSVPTLVMHPVHDAIAPVLSVYALQESLAAQGKNNVKFVFVPAGGHTFLDPDDENGFVYSQQILEFIQ